jgi:hypothetical protein
VCVCGVCMCVVCVRVACVCVCVCVVCGVRVCVCGVCVCLGGVCVLCVCVVCMCMVCICLCVCEFWDWIKLAQYRSHQRGSVNILMNVVVPLTVCPNYTCNFAVGNWLIAATKLCV